MREILFKAKRIDNGKWVEGYYAMSQNTDSITHWILEPIGAMHKIDEKTICQYTGLTDKKGNKIWENDIVYIPYERIDDSYCKVIFKYGQFIGEMADGCYDSVQNKKAEVIGNIFDNPELLEGGAE